MLFHLVCSCCGALQPVDVALQHLFSGKRIVEIDVSADASIDATARYSRKATAAAIIETRPEACDKLRAEEAAHNITVVCESLFTTCLDADFFVWRARPLGSSPQADRTQHVPVSSNLRGASNEVPNTEDLLDVFRYLGRTLHDGLVRPTAEFVVLFDRVAARRLWREMAPFARAETTVPWSAAEDREPLNGEGADHRKASMPLDKRRHERNITIAIFPGDIMMSGARPKQPNRKCPVLRKRIQTVDTKGKGRPVRSPPALSPPVLPDDVPASAVAGLPPVHWSAGWSVPDEEDTRCVKECE